ncbi:MAG: response regulator transcription factor [Sodaliphilus sp.]|nr:response regulator transcription factor [Sodaliphilus sp.]
MMKTRILLVEPSAIVGKGLLAMLQSQTRFTVADVVSDADNVESLIEAHRPDVLIINPDLGPDLKKIRNVGKVAVVALVYSHVPQSVLRHYDAIIDIDASETEVVGVIDSVTTVSEGDGDSQGDGEGLTKREVSVLVLVAEGFMNKEIADKLNVSVHTVISHRKNITRKTGIKSVAGLTIYAMVNNLIDSKSLDKIFHV